MQQPRIMFVDDELSVLRSLRREIRAQRPDWELNFFQSPKEALQKLGEIHPWVVVSDKRMQEMDGSDFLIAVREQCPEAVRVLLTGETSKDVALEMASEVHMLMAKPYEQQQLMALLHRAQCLQKLPLEEPLRQQLGAISSLPVLPKIYIEIKKLLASEDASTQKVAKLVSQEPTILAKLMQMANSAFLGYSTSVSNPHEVVMRLGLDLISKLVLALGVFRECEAIDEEQRENLLKNAIQVAELCRLLAKANGAGREETDNAFVIGMLHNIGCLVTHCDKPVMTEPKPHAPRLEDITGAYLLSLWEFNDTFVYGVFYQRNLDLSPAATRVGAYLYIANRVLSAKQQGDGLGVEPLSLNTETLARLGLLEGTESWLASMN